MNREVPELQEKRGVVLIADDVASVRLLYSTVLTDLGFQVEMAKDGLETINKIRQLKPHLVILDIGMPKVDGIKVLKVCQQISPDTRFIVITAHKDKETVLEAVKHGVVSYLAKPINLNEFRERVLSLFNQIA